MSKRTSEQLPNVLEIANPNHLEGGDEEEDVFEGSEVDSAAVDTPATGGITIIGDSSFLNCSSLKEIKFPKSLTSIGVSSFFNCSSLEQVDLLHTKVQELGTQAFRDCTSLREMKVPDSLQNFGGYVFWNCSKLVPSDINLNDNAAVVAYLRSIQ
ncbi:hypothetical protein TrVE_jg6939 [Triparma verrucosa]|uniref:Leucine-rich repeat domain-containing protein n=1 Tax=Triparma verrucosa TaxID=1606542 RepID=A0A9W7C6C8_9STRA|nr:hypothetical protein TrVE_jg6939 [Triparma verrucosa]